MTPITSNFIRVTEASTGYEYRINPNYIVSYRETDIKHRQKEDIGYTVITCKSSMGTDISAMYIMETCEELDKLLLPRFYIGGYTHDSINPIH